MECRVCQSRGKILYALRGAGLMTPMQPLGSLHKRSSSTQGSNQQSCNYSPSWRQRSHHVLHLLRGTCAPNMEGIAIVCRVTLQHSDVQQ